MLEHTHEKLGWGRDKWSLRMLRYSLLDKGPDLRQGWSPEDLPESSSQWPAAPTRHCHQHILLPLERIHCALSFLLGWSLKAEFHLISSSWAHSVHICGMNKFKGCSFIRNELKPLGLGFKYRWYMEKESNYYKNSILFQCLFKELVDKCPNWVHSKEGQ